VLRTACLTSESTNDPPSVGLPLATTLIDRAVDSILKKFKGVDTLRQTAGQHHLEQQEVGPQ
jgi:hypothetical protein